MNKKTMVSMLIILALICLISGGVFAAPQSSPNVKSTQGTLKDWIYSGSGTKYIYGMSNSTSAMGSTSNLDVHLQRNTEYGAMLILGLSDYGKQASSVNYKSLFSETANGLATTTGNVSGIYNVGNSEHVAAGIPDSTYNYYLNAISARNRDVYTTSTTALKKGDAMNLFETTISTSNWLRLETSSSDSFSYYGIARSGFSHSTYQTYSSYFKSNSSRDYGRMSASVYARAVVTQYN